jgi:hypothetical protein
MSEPGISFISKSRNQKYDTEEQKTTAKYKQINEYHKRKKEKLKETKKQMLPIQKE